MLQSSPRALDYTETRPRCLSFSRSSSDKISGREGVPSSPSPPPSGLLFSGRASAVQALPAPPSGETKLLRRKEERKPRRRRALPEGLRGGIPLRCPAMGSLRDVEARGLDTFHARYLQPDEDFLRQAREAIHRICEFLKARCFQDAPRGGIRVLKVVKGGSLGKGTSMRNGSDADLVLFLNIFRSYTDQAKNRKMILEEIERQLDRCQKELYWEVDFKPFRYANPRVLQFTLSSKMSVDSLQFDVLPAYDALGQFHRSKPNPQIYVDLIHTGGCGEFSACFTELQKNFIVDRPTKLKNLIRLVKYWYREVKENSFPPKYALELLTVYAWEKGSGETKFNMAKGFRTVLWLIEKHREICIYWTTYYDFENEAIKSYLQTQLYKRRPVILDPADPTANVGEGKRWDLLAKKAKAYASMKCCENPDGSPVEPWIVPLAMEAPQEEGWCTLV